MRREALAHWTSFHIVAPLGAQFLFFPVFPIDVIQLHSDVVSYWELQPFAALSVVGGLGTQLYITMRIPSNAPVPRHQGTIGPILQTGTCSIHEPPPHPHWPTCSCRCRCPTRYRRGEHSRT